MEKIAKMCDDATSSATEQSLQSRMLEARTDLLNDVISLLKRKESNWLWRRGYVLQDSGR